MGKEKIAVIASKASSLINFRGELIKRWSDMGYKVYALAPDFTEDIKRGVEDHGAVPMDYKLNRTGLNPAADLLSIYSLYRIMKRIKPDITYTYTIKPVIYGSYAGKLAGLEHMNSLITGLGYTFVGEGVSRKIINKTAQLMYKIALNFNELVFFQNNDDRDLFIDKGLVKEKKTVVVNGSGVNTDHFYYDELSNNISKENISFLIMARLLVAKGVKEFIEAAKRIREKYPKVNFDVLGPFNPENPDSIKKNLLQEAQEKDIINYHGEVDDVRSHIKDCTVYVLPSYREGTPRSVLEAMSMGRPIITTDVPGCRETVQDGQNGFLVSVKDAETLADKMEYFIENPDQAVVMGKNSRKMAEEKYDVHKVNETITEAMGL